MTKTISLLILILTGINGISFGQNERSWSQYGEGALAIGSDQFSGSISWSHLYGFGKSKSFKIGYGIRYTGMIGSDLEFNTAPAKLTSGEQGPQVLFVENIEANIDTFRVKKAAIHALNLAIYLQYNITPKLHVGFNIDAIGVSFGKKASGTFTSDLLSGKPTKTLEAKPTVLNALLISDNDLGSLNSELFARYLINEKIGVRAGLSFLFNEYTTTTKPVLDNDRFRKKALMVMIGGTYQF
jgi:hypothetical protein